MIQFSEKQIGMFWAKKSKNSFYTEVNQDGIMKLKAKAAFVKPCFFLAIFMPDCIDMVTFSQLLGHV